MAQKDKIKELVGRGLNSYHTKSLQQIDRIEKKNKEQNHKISILTNELDNDYLTKTEEGSVVSLEHSKEGMVYLDELQGNTLVNYCTDGSKEMTLNGDIDLEGTFVTLTEGVDNGKVDVMCEGNTLVNLATIKSVTLSNMGSKVISNLTFKQDTKYTLIFDVDSNSVTNESHEGIYLWFTADGITPSTVSALDLKGRKKYVMTRSDNANGWGIGCRNDLSGTVILNNILILEGDWTDREVPSYFEGMKSVGQDDENGHKIEILSSNSDGSESNKKEILLNEPLRGLPNGIKDRFVKIGGKWYVERNCGEVIIDESYLNSHSWGSDSSKHYVYIINGLPNQKFASYILTDKIPYSTRYNEASQFSVSSTSVIIFCFTEDIETLEERKELVRPYLQNGGLKVVYELATPTYEEITDVELITYLDTTHISNNSIIPCNMKVKNTGYNAIIKSSTLYTIALDTNKSGTIGMNLGGAKGTTTNNVLTLTTPATLTDDSLRLYGKGIKGSKVRLLEGDKTNWIPSHFEGMKSSFEDKFDATDNTYKMEILMKNKNLLDLTDIVHKAIGEGCRLDACSTELIQYTSNQEEWTNIFFMMKLKPFTRYTLSAELQSMNVYVFNDRVGNWDANKYIGAMQNTTNTLKKNQYSFTTNKNGCISIRFTNERMLGVNIAKNIILSEVAGEYIPKKSNKIQFSSIEPLRGVDNIKDKFVFKDGKLMIERNVSYIEKLISSNLKNLFKYINTNCDTMFAFKISDKAKTYKCLSNLIPNIRWGKFTDNITFSMSSADNDHVYINTLSTKTIEEFKTWIDERDISLVYPLAEPTYEEIPYELQKIILEGYENGTLFFDTNIPPTSTTTYAGETPIVKATKLNKTEVLSNTNDINDNIIPYLMDMDYRVVCLQLQSENINDGVSMARLFGGAYEMLQRDILSKRYSIEEYKYRLDAYLSVNKITEKEYEELGEMLNE